MLLSISQRTDSFVQFLTVILLFIFVLAITYITVRIIGRYQKGVQSGSNIEIIESRSVGNGKLLQIVRAGDKYLLIAVGKDEVHMISELSEDALKLKTDEDTGTVSFQSVLDKVKSLRKKDEENS